MRILIVCAILVVLGMSGQAVAMPLVEDFSGGILPDRWELSHEDAAGAPWTITVPDLTGELSISKMADTDPLTATTHRRAWIRSRFYLVGDFSTFVDFNLVEFPGRTDTGGWNGALLRLGTTTDAPREYAFMTLRFSGQGTEQYSEGFSTEPTAHAIGVNEDSTVTGRFGVTREDQTLSAWIDRGVGPVLLGSATSAYFDAPMSVQLMAAQMASGSPPSRLPTALDVRFDNLVIEADGIMVIPEPSSFVTWSLLAALGIGYGWRRRRKHTI